MNRKLRKILYAEDSENDIELTLEALSENKVANEIVVVRDGEEALDYLYYRGKFSERNKELPCVILLDLKMPKVDGIEVLKVIKSDNELKHIPVVMLTSSNLETDLVKSYDLGVNAYVVKPVDFSEFVMAVKNIGVFWALINKTSYED